MNYRELGDVAGDLDDFLIDVDELTDQSAGPDGESLDRIAAALDDARDELDDVGDFDL